MKKVILNSFGIIGFFMFSTQSFAAQLDSDSAQVNLAVGKFAKISQLEDFSLATSGVDGEEGAIYQGSDQFRLQSNCPVLVSVSGSDLSNGSSEIDTQYKLDNADTFQTDGKHNGFHQISAQATLGNINDQEAGAYVADITITVSAL